MMRHIVNGQRVETREGIACLYEGTPWHSKFSEPRKGTVEIVPWFAEKNGVGTLYVRFDSLTGDNSNDENWCRWIHSKSLTFLP